MKIVRAALLAIVEFRSQESERSMTEHTLPSIGAPATRAFAEQGITSLEDCGRVTANEALAWHGVGPRAIRLLTEAMQEVGLRWASVSDDV